MRRRKKLASMLCQAKAWAHECLGSGGPERNDHFGPDQSDFGLQPRSARLNLKPLRLGMNSVFPAPDILEVFYGVREIDSALGNPRFAEERAQELSGRTDECPTLFIFVVARLLPDEHDSRARRAIAENRLRRRFVQVASSTARRRRTQTLERRSVRHVIGS